MAGDKDVKEEESVLVEAYSDADYAADKTDRKSVTGGVLMVSGMVVGWLCRKQKCVALSTMEAEFVAASHTMAEMLGIIELLQDIGMAMQKQSIMRVDNQAAIAKIEGEDTSGRVKHSDVRYKFVKNLASKKVIKIQYCESKIMRADILTKVVLAPRLTELRVLLILTRLN